MKEKLEEYNGNGASHRLLAWHQKEGTKYALALYERKNSDTGTVSFEVQSLRWKDESKSVISGREVIFPAKWRTPSNEEFGRYGFSFSTFINAQRKFDELVKSNEEKS